MADIVRYVNTANAPGQDGLTHATGYSDYQEWMTSEAGVVASGDRHIVYCSGVTNDSSDGSFSGWTVSGELLVTAYAGDEAVSPIDDSRYVKIGDPVGMNFNVPNVTVDGIQFRLIGGSMLPRAVYRESPGAPTAINCIAVGDGVGGSASQPRVFWDLVLIRCCIAADIATHSGVTGMRADLIENCLVNWRGSNSNARYAYRADNIKNSVVILNTGLAYHSSTTVGNKNSSMISGDAPVSGGDDNTQSPWYNTTPLGEIYVDYDNHDYHLVSDSTIFANGIGEDLSGSFTTDMEGNSFVGGHPLGPLTQPAGSPVTQVDPDSLSQSQSMTSPAVGYLAFVDADALAQLQSMTSPPVDYLVFVNADDVAQLQSMSLPDVSEGVSIDPDALSQAQTMTAPDVDLLSFVAPDALVQAQSMSSPNVDYLVFVAADNLSQAQSMTSPAVTETVFLVPADLVQAQSMSQAIVVPEGAVIPLPISQAQSMSSPGIGYTQDVDPDALSQPQSLSEPGITPVWRILADDISQPQTLGEAGVITGVIIMADPVTQAQTMTEATLLVRKDVFPDFLTQAQRLDEATVFVPGLSLSEYRMWRIPKETREWKL